MFCLLQAQPKLLYETPLSLYKTQGPLDSSGIRTLNFRNSNTKPATVLRPGDCISLQQLNLLFLWKIAKSPWFALDLHIFDDSQILLGCTELWVDGVMAFIISVQ